MAFDAYALVLAMLLLGIVFAKLRAFPANAPEVINRVVLYVCLPAAVLLYVPRLEFDVDLLGVIAMPYLLLVAVLVAVALLARPLRLGLGERGALLLCLGLGNTSFLGYPLTRALLGDAALPYAVVYDQFGNGILLATFGLWVLARYGGDRPPTAGEMLRRILSFPPLWALVLGLTVMPAEPWHWLAGGLERLADAMLPLVMLAIGLSIQLRMPRREIGPLAAGLVLKLALLPLLAFALAVPLGLDGVMLQATVLEAAMPPMITAGALAIAHGLAPRLAAALVGYGLLFALGTLPLWRGFLQAATAGGA